MTQPTSRARTAEPMNARHAAATQRPRAPLTRDEREAQLRAQYVSGQITVERYEQELDDLYRRA